MSTPAKWTPPRIRALKGSSKIVVLTAYDAALAKIMDEVGVHIALVGDSLGMTVLGYDTTIPVTMDEMVHHTSAVARGVSRAMVITDMPFLSYQVSISQAVENAGLCIKEGQADGLDQPLRLGVLQQVAAGPGLDGAQDVGVGVVGGQDQHPRRRVAAQQLAGHVDAVVGAQVEAAQQRKKPGLMHSSELHPVSVVLAQGYEASRCGGDAAWSNVGCWSALIRAGVR